MKQLSTEAFCEIRTWIYRNARPLDLAIWQWNFENGSREQVVRMLSFYQNEDGGFGHAVEPDSWNPNSSPYSTLIVIGLLRGMDVTDRSHPLVDGIFRYLESSSRGSEDGWMFSIPSNDEYAHAPWWTYSEASNALQNMGITAGICAFILRYGDRQSELYARAMGYVDRILEHVSHTGDFGEMGAGSLGILAMDIEAAGLSSRFDVSSVREMLPALINRTIERDPDKWELYTPRPSEFIWSPDSCYYPGNEAIVETELDYLIDTRTPGGVWNITWTWFDLGEAYPKEFAISENWWKAFKAMEKLRFLGAFGRILRPAGETV